MAKNKTSSYTSVILRTIYLSPSIDRDIRNLAFRTGMSKNKIIMELLEAKLEEVKKAGAFHGIPLKG